MLTVPLQNYIVKKIDLIQMFDCIELNMRSNCSVLLWA